MIVLKAEHLWKEFDSEHGQPTVAVDDVSLEFNDGTMTSIVGPSGSGKSTLLYCLSGLMPVDKGQIELFGHDIVNGTPSQNANLRQGNVGFIFQALNLVSSLTVLENVLISAQFAGLEIDVKRAESILQAMGLANYIHDYVLNLSGGQQQRIAVARVLYLQPKIVFADEPTGALDSANASFVIQQLRFLADRGSAVVMVTHSLEDASASDFSLVIHDGRLTHQIVKPTEEELFALVGRNKR